MINPSHVVVNHRLRTCDIVVFYVLVRHKDCGHIMATNKAAGSYSELAVSFSLQCGKCGKYGGPKDWDSFAKEEHETALRRVMADNKAAIDEEVATKFNLQGVYRG